MTEEKFLIDSNSFITPARLYYAFDLVPSYWKALSEHSDTGRLILLDMVKEEINKGKDDLSAWINQETGFAICKHVEPAIIGKYQEVMNYLQSCRFYSEKAIWNWSQDGIADPWLIAAAAVNGYTIITAEVPSGALSVKTPSKNAKIPDVAREFGVKTKNLFYMMREMGIRV